MKYIAIFTFICSIAFAAIPAHALKVRCTDPQPAINTKHTQVRTVKYYNTSNMADIRQQMHAPAPKGRLQVAEHVPNRGPEYAPQPLRKGSSFRVCRN